MFALKAPAAAPASRAATQRSAAPCAVQRRSSFSFCSGPLAVRQRRALQQQWRTRAEGEEPPQGEPQRPKPTVAPPRGKKEKEDQTVAIVTGAISVLIGFVYLFGVVLLNSRGNQMVPPPPEAFGWLLGAAVKGML